MIISNSPKKVKIKLFTITIFCVILLSFPPIIEVETYQIQNQQNIIPPDISVLEMDLPPNATIGTFEEYQSSHPYSQSIFTQHHLAIDTVSTSKSCSILIEEKLYTNQIEEKIDQYIYNLEEKGYLILSIDTISGGNPKEIKNWVKTQYQNGAVGVIFIGDIPVAWADVSDSIFPCDLFYMDVDGLWTDSNNDDIYENHASGSGDMGPELFVGRLFASSLQWNDEETLILDYFDKIHQYNTGNLSVPWRGLEYVDEDWYSMDINLDEVFDENISRYDFGYQTTAKDYLDNLQKGQHFVTVCAHSYSGGHHFGRHPTEAVTYAHVYVFSPIQRDAKLLLGSDDGIIAWLNGENILQKDVYTGWIEDQYRIDVTLNQGWNRLLCKISQESWDYQLSARFTDEQLNSIPDLKYQMNNPEYSGSEATFIRSWLVNGFHQDSSDRFWEYLNTNYLLVNEAQITPVEGELMGGKIWTIYSSGAPYINLDEHGDNADFGATYCYTKINADKDINCELWTGYDDGMKAWLNGKEIIMDNRYGDYISDMTKTSVELQSGENHLIIKISEWVGNHGFSARLCTSNGEKIDGLTFNPSSDTISHIGTWLIAGPYENDDKDQRMTTEYINDESEVAPFENESVEGGTWKKAIGNGCPFDIAGFFNHGDWVYSETIQKEDPPVLFYNLFSCGPGRFTDENYLAGSYIFNTSYGLVTIASSKSGSMLYFQDFTRSLGEGKSIGESFVDWFNLQAPFTQWEKEWYYGLVLCGDPTLTINPTKESSLSIDISSPTNGIYTGNNRIFSFFTPLVFGDVTIKIDIINPGDGIKEVSFYVNDELCLIDDEFPYEYFLEGSSFGKQSIQVIATDQNENSVVQQRDIWRFS
ncbi:MAG: hypothetical protein DRN27_06175 [Thermoplasmata archaeon]|nr:MAG: hypothetical protein DRN27_06175 [Thermoplasmata archaeon]